MRTILNARYEGVFRALDAVRAGGSFPGPFDEDVPGTVFEVDGSTEKFKGQAFLTNMVYRDADQRTLVSDREGRLTLDEARDRIERALTFDNMTVLMHNDISSGHRIPNQVFEDIAVSYVHDKRNIHRQVERLSEVPQRPVRMSDIVRSYLPPVEEPGGGFGTKAVLTAALAVGAFKSNYFADKYRAALGITYRDADLNLPPFRATIRRSQEPVRSASGELIANDHIVVAHASPYMPDAVQGLTRILGFRGTRVKRDRFGEFETVSFERATNAVMRQLTDHARVPEDAIWAYHVPRSGGRRVPIVAVWRHYPRAREPGSRPPKDEYALVTPRDFGLDPLSVREEAVAKLGLAYAAPVPGER